MSQNSDVYSKAVDLLAIREHSTKELIIKLQNKFPKFKDFNEIIERLQRENLLNNTRYAQAYIRMRAKKGFGSLRISQELKEKGITTEIINENISDEIDWYLVMQQAFKKKYPLGKADSLKDVIKQKRFLANRGFSFEEIESVFD